MGSEIEVELSTSSYGDIIARINIPNIAMVMPPESADRYGNCYSSSRHVRKMTRKAVIKLLRKEFNIIDNTGETDER